MIDKYKNERIYRQEQKDQTYMVMSMLIASFSRAKRLKTAAIIVKDGVVISTGYNGTPKGAKSNDCEVIDENGDMVTHPFVLHGEANAVYNLVMSNSGSTIKGSTIYTLYSPCKQCAALIKHVGITRVVYMYEYRITESLDWLRENGVEVDKCIIDKEHNIHLSDISQIMMNKNE